MKDYRLPKVSKKKKIDIKEFVALGKRVRKYFEEENREYLRKKRNENISSGRLSFDY